MKAALCLPVLLTACVAAAPAPEPSPHGEVHVGVQSWPIEAVDAQTWQVRIDGQPVRCSAPTQEACYWSVRNYLNAQSVMDDLG